MIEKKVLIYCANGYQFEEIFLPIIEENYKKWNIELIIDDYYVNLSLKSFLDKLLYSNKIKSFNVFPTLSFSIAFIKKIKMFLKLFNKEFNILLLGSDCTAQDRYLIYIIKKHINSKVIIIETGTMWRHYNEDKKNYINQKTINNYINKFKSKNILQLIKTFKNKFKSKMILIKKKINFFIHHFLMPKIIINSTFSNDKTDKYAFTSGRGDAVIVFSEKNAKILKKNIPNLKNIFVSNHPLSEYNSKKANNNSNVLLVLFAQNLNDELTDERLDKWVYFIKKSASINKVTEIHLRCHPRTSPNLLWPNKIKKRIEDYGYKISIIDSSSINLVKIIHKYFGVIGAPSGSLIVSRALRKDIFVVCIDNCSSGGPDDQSWMMGDLSGINVVQPNQSLSEKDFEINENIYNYSSISQILNKIMNNNFRYN
jgi:hypothetical protein